MWVGNVNLSKIFALFYVMVFTPLIVFRKSYIYIHHVELEKSIILRIEESIFMVSKCDPRSYNV